MQVVYLDVLLVFNLYVNYLLLRITARITHTRLRMRRCLVCAALGSISTLMIFLPPMPALLSVLCKLLVAVILCTAAFGMHDRMRLCWCSICLFGSSFALAGILLALSLLSGVRVVHVNSCWYLDVSLLHLILFTIAAYILLHTVQYLHDRSHAAAEGFRVCIRYRRCTVQLNGIADTGNSLVDFFTGKPVMICDAKAFGDMPDTLRKGFRLIPFRTISGEGMIPVFQPEEITIFSERTGQYRSPDVLIGLGGQSDGTAVFHPKILRF